MNNTNNEKLKLIKTVSFVGGCIIGGILLIISLQLFSTIGDITDIMGGYGQELNVLPFMILTISVLCFIFAFTSKEIISFLLNEINSDCSQTQNDSHNQLKI